ncbi:MAG: hypothetical protein OXC91_11530 [Rhodobacteraceae bacterium]|nr:hypothetical protein [Paracoccaceae bacterium]
METQISEDLAKKISELIENQLSEGLDIDVAVRSIDVIADDMDIIFKVAISKHAEPDQIAQRYFHLTGQVRDALGEKWGDFFL